MSDPDAIFTAEEICAQARADASAGILVAFTLARHHGWSVPEAARFIGQIFAPSWDEIETRNAYDAARAATLILVSGGAEVRRLAGDARRAEAIVAGWPSPAELAFFGFTEAEADAYHELHVPIAERLGLRYAWRREGDAIVMTFAAPE